MRPSFSKIIRPKKERAQGMPGACCTRGLVCKNVRKTHTSIQVQSEHSDIPRAMALRLIPCSPRRRIRLVTVADGLKDCLNPVGSTPLRQLDTSNGCQNHTVLPYAASPVVRALCSLTDRSPPCEHHHAPDAAASTASRPPFVTMANVPLPGRDGGSYAADLGGDGKRNIFLGRSGQGKSR
jgi:hypothetical protein